MNRFFLTCRWTLLSLASVAAVFPFDRTIARDFSRGALRVLHPVAPASVPGQTTAAVYLTLENTGKVADQLLAVKTPVADTAELHSMTMVGNVMKMREAERVALAPGAKIAMEPGNGYHIMLLGLHHPLRAGEQIGLRLRFAKAGTVLVQVQVETQMPAHDGAP